MASTRRRSARIVDSLTSKCICERAVLSDTFISRLVGLLGRSSLDRNEGLWIHPSSGVHTLGMKFPIDVVALNKTMHVIQLDRSVAPWRIAGMNFKIKSVLELPCGSIEATGLTLGDCLIADPLPNS